jgi:hypothetical protein
LIEAALLKTASTALALAALLAAGSALAQPAAPPPATPPTAPAAPLSPPPAPNDYADKANWLCWPGRADACESDLTTTVVKADGSTSVQTFKPAPNAPIDCFYVYPTVSTEPGVISDMKVEAAETNVVVQQAARLTAKCRLYAPMYRQLTLTALRGFITGQLTPAAAAAAHPQTGYNDVKDAWNYYLAHENHGRGVVLVGHSQGSGVLTQLIRNEIDGKPAQARLVSAILMGTPLVVPDGKDVGGDFQTVALCQSPSQLGCVIAYSSFRDDSPPPDNSRFGRPRNGAAGMEAACANPASLGGGTGEAKNYFATGAAIVGAPQQFAWVKGKTIATPFVSLPGLITATCVHTGPFHYLAIHVDPDPAGPRTSQIPGDVVVGGAVLKDWGLHLIDANLFMGNLVDIVGAESKAWKARNR